MTLPVTPPPAATTPPHTRAWRHGRPIAEGFAVADVSEHLDADPDTIVWVDLCQPDRDQLLLAEELSLHELAVEDALGAALAIGIPVGHFVYFRHRDWL